MQFAHRFVSNKKANKGHPVTLRALLITVSVLLISLNVSVASATSVYVTPLNTVVDASDGTTVLQLYMDFQDDPTLGGGLDLNFTGSVSLLDFTPSEWFLGLDSFFTGYTTAAERPEITSSALAIWFGDFNGLGGLNEIGTFTLALNGQGPGAVSLGINPFFGAFQSATTFSQQEVSLNGATVDVVGPAPVPLPGAVWLMLSGLAAFTAMRRRLTPAQ